MTTLFSRYAVTIPAVIVRIGCITSRKSARPSSPTDMAIQQGVDIADAGHGGFCRLSARIDKPALAVSGLDAHMWESVLATSNPRE
jgi:hypothetical protein